MDNASEQTVHLKRSIGLTGLVLYGLGVTIGAGIYVLVGETIVRAGSYAPAAFLISAIVMGFTAASFAELSGRVPRAAGEAVYVEHAFGIGWLTVVVGLAVLAEAMIAAAAIAVGSAGYVAELIALPRELLVICIVLLMAMIAAWGIRESVAIAGAMTLVEVLGLLVIIYFGLANDPGSLNALPPALLPSPTDLPAMSGVLAASMIAFFAFIGFDDVVNLVEEAKNPAKIMPWAIGITLLTVTVLYILVSFVAAQNISVEEFGATSAPVSLLFERLTGLPPLAITLVAIIATMNGVVIILIMAARVAYGMAQEGRLPAWIGAVSPLTQTPLRATVIVTAIVLVLAIFTPLDTLAETSSEVILAIFLTINLALVWFKIKKIPTPPGAFKVSIVFPILGAVLCLALLIGASLVGS
ncbi:APC family permease [Sulfitobacter sp. SK011]|uniref:APC family permease n=1 Tax=Sulfitobacter sp. SK011 TaxID=1389004 RepID=UPI000E0C130C|nr:amino acid permease [Sulfitobacter sp. SK011]AXI43921.1 amino acid permease [Sulfitobacter sp. SK011]